MTDDLYASIADLAGAVPRLADEVRRIAREVGEETFEGSGADGAVRATVTGLGVLRDVTIDVLARRELDNLTLGDAVVEAIRAAEATAREAMRDRMAGLVLGGRTLAEFLPGGMGGGDR